MKTATQPHGLLSQRLRAHDWLASVGVHLALLASVAWGVSNSALGPPSITPLTVALSWATEPAPAPKMAAPPPPPQPPAPAPQPRPTPRALQPTRMPTPVAPVLQAMPSVVAAPDGVVPAAPLALPAPAKAINTDAAPVSPPAAAMVASPPAPKADELPRWHSQLEAMLLKHKQYPMVGRRMRQEGVVTVMAHFSAQGELLRCAIATSSGFKALDEAAMQLVRQAAEMARAHHQPGQVAELHIPIVYELKES